MPEGKKRGWRWVRRLNSLQARMALVLGIALAPSLLYSFWQAFDVYRIERARQADETLAMLRSVAGEIDAFLAETDHDRLAFVSDAVAVDGGTAPAGHIALDQVVQQTLAGLNVPLGRVVGVVDAQGSHLDDPAASLPGEDVLRALIARPNRPLDDETSGRAYLAAPVPRAGLFVVGGLPEATAWRWFDRGLLVGLLLPPLMLGLAVVVIWIASDYLVNRHIRRLALATRAYSQGESDAFMDDLRGAPIELRELAAAFARMARRVRDREDRLRDTIAAREGHLREIHHRIKNNLQIVTSLLNLRARRVTSVEARESLAEAQARIKALVLVHRSLYTHEERQRIDFTAFLHELAATIEDGIGGGRDEVRLEITAEPVTVSADQAIPLALMTVEAVSNAYKHAFPDDRDLAIKQGRIRVDLRATDPRHGRLTVADNGVGGGTTALGLTLIRMFVKQMHGRIEVSHADGLCLSVTFPRF